MKKKNKKKRRKKVSESRVQYLVDEQGKKTGVFLSYTKYHRLMEDLHDLKMIMERKDEKPISFAKFKRRLRRKGLV